MTQTSFPLVNKKLTDAAWGQAVGAVGNGILDDWGVPYSISVNTNDTITVRVSTTTGVARAVVNGFGHQMDANETLTIPAVSAQTTYQVGLLYDPSNAALPVRLAVLKGSPPVLAAGAEFLPMFVFNRAAGQTLAAALRYFPRPRIRPQIHVVDFPSLQSMNPLSFARGTTAYCSVERASYIADFVGSTPTWVALDPGRKWDFPRSGGNERDPIPSGRYVTVMNGTLTDAPAGSYLIGANVNAFSANPGNGNLRVVAGGKNLSLDARIDSMNGRPVETSFTRPFTHGGGDLRIETFLQFEKDGTIISNGSGMWAAYLGPA